MIKYINYNGDINKYLLIYINEVLVYKDDTKASMTKTKQFSIKKGHNEIDIEYIIDKNIQPENNNDIESYLEIYKIQMTNAETSSLECQKYDNMDNLKDTIFNNCEYDVTKCEETDFCTYRFFTESSKGNNIKNGTQEIFYNKIEGAACQELIIPEKIEIEADLCSYGQYLKLKDNSETIYNCDLCTGEYFNDKIINYDKECTSKCDVENKNLRKIFYINSFVDPSQYLLDTINITERIGYVEVNYEKYNLREDAKIFVEILDKLNQITNTYQLTNPDKDTDISNGIFNFVIPLEIGEYNVQIKGKNFKLKEIKIINNNEGGNYKCTDILESNAEVECKDNPEEYYSKQIKKIKFNKFYLKFFILK